MTSLATFFKEQNDFYYRSGTVGEAQGAKKAKEKTALEMKIRGFELGLISDITELSIKEIENLSL